MTTVHPIRGELRPSGAGGASARGRIDLAQTLAVRVIAYLTNHLVAHLPSYRLRHAWYRRVLGLSLARSCGIHLGCFLWFNGPGQVRRDESCIGARTRINRDCCLDMRGPLLIGDDVSVSPEVMILTGQHRHDRPGLRVRDTTGRHRGPRVDRLQGHHPARDVARARRRGGGRCRGQRPGGADDRGRRYTRTAACARAQSRHSTTPSTTPSLSSSEAGFARRPMSQRDDPPTRRSYRLRSPPTRRTVPARARPEGC